MKSLSLSLIDEDTYSVPLSSSALPVTHPTRSSEQRTCKVKEKSLLVLRNLQRRQGVDRSASLHGRERRE